MADDETAQSDSDLMREVHEVCGHPFNDHITILDPPHGCVLFSDQQWWRDLHPEYDAESDR